MTVDTKRNRRRANRIRRLSHRAERIAAAMGATYSFRLNVTWRKRSTWEAGD